MVALLKATYRLSTIPIKIPFFAGKDVGKREH
jgi:hypothetical protein